MQTVNKSETYDVCYFTNFTGLTFIYCRYKCTVAKLVSLKRYHSALSERGYQYIGPTYTAKLITPQISQCTVRKGLPVRWTNIHCKANHTTYNDTTDITIFICILFYLFYYDFFIPRLHSIDDNVISE